MTNLREKNADSPEEGSVTIESGIRHDNADRGKEKHLYSSIEEVLQTLGEINRQMKLAFLLLAIVVKLDMEKLMNW